ncbi:MAG: hypothetical protein V4645_18150 [Pseudomonadota bacterium]
MNWSPELLLTLGGIAVNAAVTWGVLSTKLDFLRRDVDHAHKRIDSASERLGLIAERTRCERN